MVGNVTNTPEPIQQVIERLHELLREYQDAAYAEAQKPMSRAARATATRTYRRYANYTADTAPRLAQALTEALARIAELEDRTKHLILNVESSHVIHYPHANAAAPVMPTGILETDTAGTPILKPRMEPTP
jgi:hypothetical protein